MVRISIPNIGAQVMNSSHATKWRIAAHRILYTKQFRGICAMSMDGKNPRCKDGHLPEQYLIKHKQSHSLSHGQSSRLAEHANGTLAGGHVGERKAASCGTQLLAIQRFDRGTHHCKTRAATADLLQDQSEQVARSKMQDMHMHSHIVYLTLFQTRIKTQRGPRKAYQ